MRDCLRQLEARGWTWSWCGVIRVAVGQHSSMCNIAALLLVVALVSCLAQTLAFAPRTLQSNQIKRVHRMRTRHSKLAMTTDKGAAEARRLSDQAAKLREEIAAMEGDRPKPAPKAEPLQAKADADEDAGFKEKELSEAMKAKLRKELISQGADPNRSSGNGILIVAAVIGVLVVLGGQGIFYGLPLVGVNVGGIMREAFAAAGSGISA
eukprot:TRINITY_DN3176_c0_g1_i4.p2 TRINITY_DN3176_c0_g1~~TRINITY_DN3176_c0_g1_i4.p2  ORF type:complete len:209 (-),score=70.02 TRINITY_DN3176_c0_g1_i4:637-1263(-)